MTTSEHAGRRFLIGVVTLAVAVALGHLALTANQGRLPGTPVTVVRAAFTDVGQLQPGSEVRQSGRTIGQVSRIALVDGAPVVTMTIPGSVAMYRDGYAGIWDQSALSQKFVELRSGNPASGLLGDTVLPARQTEPTHDLVQLLDVFDAPTRAALGNGLRQLGGGLAGHGPGLHDFVAAAPSDLTAVGQIATTLSSDATDLPSLLHTTNRLSGRFTGREQQITTLLAQTDQTLRALETDAGRPLGQTISKLPTTVGTLRRALDDAKAPLTALASATRELRSGAGAVGDATPDVRGVFREALGPLHRTPDVADEARPAVEDLTRTLADARPFAPRLADGLSSAAAPLRALAPYRRDIAVFALDFSTLLTNHDGWAHQLRIMAGGPTPVTVLDNQIKDANNPYPKPGQAIRDRDATGGLVPGR